MSLSIENVDLDHVLDSIIYRNIVEDTATKVDPVDVLIPVDILAKVESMGFEVDAFQDDVLHEVEYHKTSDDPRQKPLPFS